MRLPIRNMGAKPLTVWVEIQCEEHVVPVDGEAIVRLEDGKPHSLDVSDGWVTIWDEGIDASVEVIQASDRDVDEALQLIATWLHRMGGAEEATTIVTAVERLEPVKGYLRARVDAFAAFDEGFRDATGDAGRAGGAGSHTASACRRAGTSAARLNAAARLDPAIHDLRTAPFDSDVALAAFARARQAVARLRGPALLDR